LGAVDFLEKPVEGARLLDAVSNAVALDAVRRGRRRDSDNAKELLAQLTPRERQVCELVARGLLNKQIADEIGASERTVKIHRARAVTEAGHHVNHDWSVCYRASASNPVTGTSRRALPGVWQQTLKRGASLRHCSPPSAVPRAQSTIHRHKARPRPKPSFASW
jgi:DNA-binding CsgD family transcriptional regulator